MTAASNGINEIKKEREKFVSNIDTLRYRSNYKDINGKDSLGSEQIQISASKFSPRAVEPLTLEYFEAKRKQLNIPNSLGFTINYEQYNERKNER